MLLVVVRLLVVLLGVTTICIRGQTTDIYVATPSTSQGFEDGSINFPITNLSRVITSIDLNQASYNIIFAPGSYPFPAGNYLFPTGLNRSLSFSSLSQTQPGQTPDVTFVGSGNTAQFIGPTSTNGRLIWNSILLTGCTSLSNPCLFLSDLTDVSFTNVRIVNSGSSVSTGGAISAAVGSLSLDSCIFERNTATSGAALFLNRPTMRVVIRNSRFSRNSATNGGAITLNAAQSVDIIDSLINFNQATGFGSALHSPPAPTMKINLVNSQITDNVGAFAIHSSSDAIWNLNSTSVAFNSGGGFTFKFSTGTGVGRVTKDTIIWANGIDVACDPGLQFDAEQNGPTIDLCQRASTCPAWDRCFVCRGNDTCVGCDGVPYGPTTGCIATKGNLIAPSRANAAIKYPGTDPSPILFGLNSALSFSLEFVSFREVRQDNSVAVEVPFSRLRFFFHESTGDEGNVSSGVFSSVSVATGFAVDIQQTFFVNGQSLTLGGVPFNVDPQTLKVSFKISNWPFEDKNRSTNTLEVKVRTKTGELITFIEKSITNLTSSFISEKTKVFTANTQNVLTLLNFALFSSPLTNSTLNSTLQSIEVIPIPAETNSTVSTYVFRFPGYFQSVFYDPDVAIVVAPEDSDSDDDPPIGLIVGLTVGIPLGMLLIVGIVLVVLGVLGWYSHHKLNSRSMSVNWGKGDDAL